MGNIKYLYVDDNENGKESVQNFPDGNFFIDVVQPTETIGAISKKAQKYNGLILDQQLDEKSSEGRTVCDYVGSTLAINIRAKENESNRMKKDISKPIILLSASPSVPLTLYDLGDAIFDMKIFKSEGTYQEFKDSVPLYRNQMISLVKGYDKLKKLKIKGLPVKDSLGLAKKIDIIDSRFLDELNRREDRTAHSKASFILNELIVKQGILIDDDILAVRLGIDKDASPTGWNKVLESLTKFGAKYKGVFCDGWSRWWMPMVDEWWYKLEGNDTYIRFYSAEQRAKLIEEKLNMKLAEKIQLIPAKAKSKFSVHSDYWTLCDSTKDPLDIEDGLMLPNQENLYPWQDAKYVAIQSAWDYSIEVADCDKEKKNRFKKR